MNQTARGACKSNLPALSFTAGGLRHCRKYAIILSGIFGSAVMLSDAGIGKLLSPISSTPTWRWPMICKYSFMKVAA